MEKVARGRKKNEAFHDPARFARREICVFLERLTFSFQKIPCST